MSEDGGRGGDVRMVECEKNNRFTGQGFMFLVSMLIAAAFLLAVQLRVVTYVCGNDPMLYMRAARTILQPDLYGFDALRQALTFVAPGYPLILAGVTAIAGDLAPYWSNLVFLLFTLPLMWIVFLKLTGSTRAAAFMLLFWLWIAIAGHPLHAPFLLYPFREVPRMLLVYAAYAMILKAVDNSPLRKWQLIAAGVAMLGACSIREPSILIMPGLLAGVLCLNITLRRRAAVWLWVLLPWFLASIPALIILLRLNFIEISQFSVIQYLRHHHVALSRARQMMTWFPERMTWIGFIFILAGIVRASLRSRVMLAWFLVPACMFFVFYSYMQRHDRYFFTTIVFMSVFAGYGLDWLCVGLIGLAGKLKKTVQAQQSCFNSGLTVLAFILLFAGLIHTVRRVEAWGPRIRATDVRGWQELVAGLKPSEDGRIRIAVDQRCRYLEDMLISYTDADILDPKAIDGWPQKWSPAHYFRPLNRQAEYATPQWLMYLKVYAHRLMANRMNVEQSGMAEVQIGHGRYRHYDISAWSAGTHRQTVQLHKGKGNVLWLDWGQSAPESTKAVKISCEVSGRQLLNKEVAGNGLQALFIDSALTVDSDSVIVEFNSDSALPSSPVIGVVAEGEKHGFVLGVDRVLSSNLMFSQRNGSDDEPQYLYWRGDRDFVFSAPEVISGVPVKLFVYLYGNTDVGSGRLIAGNGSSGSKFIIAPAGAGRGIGFAVKQGEEVVLSVRSDKAPFAAGEFYFDQVSIEIMQE